MKTLVLIYNADSGDINAAIDAIRKIIAPGRYSCSLCAITHGPFSMKPRWREFLLGLDMKVQFLHRDEYEDAGPGTELPMILMRDEFGITRTLLSADDIRQLNTVDELINEIDRRLAVEFKTR